jgi:hypothetical protein
MINDITTGTREKLKISISRTEVTIAFIKAFYKWGYKWGQSKNTVFLDLRETMWKSKGRDLMGSKCFDTKTCAGERGNQGDN